MDDLRDAVTFYVGRLIGPVADDACHSLLELGPSALPAIGEAFRVAKSGDVKLRLAQVIAHSRVPDAMPLLVELLENQAPEIWKTALDGLVMLGNDDVAARKPVLEILAVARHGAASTKADWILEAIGQIRALDAPEPG